MNALWNRRQSTKFNGTAYIIQRAGEAALSKQGMKECHELIDYYMEKGGERYLMEVQGCTLEIDGIGYFPDAPTERGIKHLQELIKAQEEGYPTALAFVIQMNGITEVRPNMTTHPAFGQALEEARKAGVDVIFIECDVREQEVTWKR